MKEPYMKGEAAPLWPRVMRGQNREVAREALTGGSAGQPLSSEITRLGCQPCTTWGKATRHETLDSESHVGPAESETLSMRGHSMHENREIATVPVLVWAGRSGKACGV